MKQWIVLAAVLGVVDPSCTLKDICTPGYTKMVRPPASYTNNLKSEQMFILYLPGDMSQYEEDHIVPLELCGAPRDPDNLTPELWERARKKDVLETRFHRAVCSGKMTLEEAQRQIVTFE